jgi:16S rRNA (cytidine1402-2'-O)-methyltransferase
MAETHTEAASRRPLVQLVPTPIGHLADITLRSLDALRQADRIAAEDTRHSRRLLDHYAIDTPLLALHQHNEHQRIPALLAQVEAEAWHLAVITDAGTPGISDPGYLIVREALARGLAVEALPGPTAFVPALVASGLPCDRFAFEGFLPVKKGRQTRLQELAAEPRTLILYEGPHRLERTLAQLAEYLGGERPAALARELTKVYEEYIRGSLSDLVEHCRRIPPKGECVVVVGGRP